MGGAKKNLSVSEPHSASRLAPLPLVAIVTPVYNGAKFLAEVMDAVQAQTYPKLVHIVQDNASTDATPEIIARYANARVPVVVERNEETIPLYDNWNVAMSRVPKEAKYFRMLCADDFMEPTYMSRLVEFMEQNPGVIVACCDVGFFAAPDDLWDSLWDADKNVFSGKEAIGRFFLGEGIIVAIHALIRREALDLRSPLFDRDLMLADTDMCLDLLRHGDWGFVHETLAMQNDHPDSVTSTVTRLNRIDAVDIFVLLERYGAYGLGEKRAREEARQYKRYYVRQLLFWRLKRPDIFARHMAATKAVGHRPYLTKAADLWDFADALVDWAFIRLGLREPWRGQRGF